ncbi:MAG: hypothetical protein A3G40_12585 [Deltaproteobacteria bacterium RIFCSPLOWO2_12_FULL_57_22]|nr:MAG: hypothetical protein A3G40_12585 [Deltaproteobacteria bacterium RIFCSPLOWO2_12_FULL_57_22]
MKAEIMDLKPYLPQLSVAERDRRWSATRERMAAKGLDCLVVWGNTISQGLGMTNVRYLTQVGSWHGGVALFPLAGEVTLFSAPRHMSLPYNGYLAAQDWIQDIRPFSMKAIVEEIKARGFERGRIGVVSYGNVVAGNNLTYHDYLDLQAGLRDATFTDESEMVEELRRTKSPEEIAMLEKSGAIARKVVDTMIQTAAPGVRENELYAAMIRTQLVEGAEPNIFILMSSGPLGTNGDLKRRLLHGNDQPLCPSQRPLERGDLVICEFHVSYGGYLSAVEFTVAVGKPPQELRDLHAAAVECLQAAVENAAREPPCTNWRPLCAPPSRAGAWTISSWVFTTTAFLPPTFQPSSTNRAGAAWRVTGCPILPWKNTWSSEPTSISTTRTGAGTWG